MGVPEQIISDGTLVTPSGATSGFDAVLVNAAVSRVRDPPMPTLGVTLIRLAARHHTRYPHAPKLFKLMLLSESRTRRPW